MAYTILFCSYMLVLHLDICSLYLGLGDISHAIVMRFICDYEHDIA